MKSVIGIFQGKQKTNNKFLLETLYEKGPLTAWELTREYTKNQEYGGGRHSLHAIFNKRLRGLKKKGYLNKSGKKWVLHFKGTIAILLIQSEPKMWNKKWTEIFENYVHPIQKSNKKYTIAENGKNIFEITDYAKRTPNELRTFDNWIVLSERIKNIMVKGFINLDVIKNRTLLLLILSEFSDEQIKKE